MADENARAIVSVIVIVIVSHRQRSVLGSLFEPGLADIDRHHRHFQDRRARGDSNPTDVNVPK
jgi:hypothetical protein